MDDVRAVMDAAGASAPRSSATPKAARCASCSRPRIRRARARSSSTARTRSGSAATTTRGRRPWEERVAVAEELERDWGENFDLVDDGPNATPRVVAWFERRGRGRRSARRRARPHPHELEGRRPRRCCRACRPDARPAPHGRPRRERRGGPLHRGAHSRRAIRRASRRRPRPVRSTPDQILDEVEEFLTGARPARRRATACSRPCSSPTSSARRTPSRELGDRALGRAARSAPRPVRRELARFGGEEVDTAGDGFLALFDGPARAIRCALGDPRRAARARARDRASASTPARSSGAGRGASRDRGPRRAPASRRGAAPGEVLVSQTTRDLVEGRGSRFEDRGEHELKGIVGAAAALRRPLIRLVRHPPGLSSGARDRAAETSSPTTVGDRPPGQSAVEPCWRCGTPMEWRHATLQCPRCHFKIGCCEGPTAECSAQDR